MIVKETESIIKNHIPHDITLLMDEVDILAETVHKKLKEHMDKKNIQFYVNDIAANHQNSILNGDAIEVFVDIMARIYLENGSFMIKQSTLVGAKVKEKHSSPFRGKRSLLVMSQWTQYH
jgi:hypothetical protein